MSMTVKQVGGSHYKELAIQPITYIQKNGLGYCEGNVIKYITRWNRKHQAPKEKIDDLRKAIHYIELLIEEHDIG